MANLDQGKIDFIVKVLKNIEYGSLVITIHDGQIQQIDSTQKNRFDTKSKLNTKKPY